MSLKIIFMGTPEFAVPSLRALTGAGYEVAGVVCQPDRPRGRSGKPVFSPVKEAALDLGLNVMQFESVRRQEALDAFRALKPDLFVTAAFGQILSNKVLSIPPMGTINVHASLLPKYRGSAPINRCIMGGETVTGVTTMYTERGVDTGDMLLSRTLEIRRGETAGELTLRLADLGAEVLLKTLSALQCGTLVRIPQDASQATYQPLLTKEDGRIDWNRTASEIEHQVLGVNPWPGAYTDTPFGTLKIWRAEAVEVSDDINVALNGTVIASDIKKGLIIKCASGALNVIELQMPGARRLYARDYLNGKHIAVGEILGSEA